MPLQVMQFVAAVGFTMIEPGWTLFISMYHCLVTATTVGFGDISITTSAGRVFASIHILVSVAALGATIGEIDSIRSKRKELLERADRLRKELDQSMIDALDKNGDGVDKFEFIIGSLVHLGMVKQKEVDTFSKSFERLDKSGDGRLTRADLEQAQEEKHRQHAQAATKMKHMQQGNASTSKAIV